MWLYLSLAAKKKVSKRGAKEYFRFKRGTEKNVDDPNRVCFSNLFCPAGCQGADENQPAGGLNNVGLAIRHLNDKTGPFSRLGLD